VCGFNARTPVVGESFMVENNNVQKQRIIQEYVPGKQVTLAHVIANPQRSIYLKLGLDNESAGAIGIMTITPYEGVIIAADVATKAASVDIGFLDRFGGSLLLVGDVASVEASVREVLNFFENVLHYSTADMTHS
jgi:ethanolamine utilization protein EutS